MILTQQIKALENKNANCKYQQSTMKNQLGEKDKQIFSLQDELNSLETFRIEKEKTEKYISDLIETNNSLKCDLEKEIKRHRDMKKSDLEMKIPSKENSDMKSQNNVSESSLAELRKRVIKKLENENKLLKDKVKKIEYDYFKVKENNIENEINNNVPTQPNNLINKGNFISQENLNIKSIKINFLKNED